MEINIRLIKNPSDAERKQLSNIWQEAFGDSREYIEKVMALPSYRGAVSALCGGRIVSAAHLLAVEGDNKAYYGYAVSTAEKYRGRGACARVHEYIFNMCKRENAAYLLHPADSGISRYYRRLGMEELLFLHSASCCGDGGTFRDASPGEYRRLRELYFGASGYYGWGEDVLRFASVDGLRFITFEIEGVLCAAAVSEKRVSEVCAPSHLEGQAVLRAAEAAGAGEKAQIMFLDSIPISAECAVMGFNCGTFSYFNLFLD